MASDEEYHSSSDSSQDLFSFDDIDINRTPSKINPLLQNRTSKATPLNRATSNAEQKQELELHNFVSQDMVEKERVGIEEFGVLSVLGKGAYGKVYLVQKNSSKAFYAMKVLKKASIILSPDPSSSSSSALNERQVLDKLRHPFIVRLFYAFQTPSKLFLILTYAQGGELFNYLAEMKMFSDAEAVFYISELLLAIEHLHSLGIIYRDLKPENVMLCSEGHVLLTDFGLSKISLDQEASTVCGTVEFMAPEILEERRYDKTVDFWSLGIMLYDMIVGKPPFTGSNRKRIMDSVLGKKPVFPNYMTATTRDLCTKLLKKNPKVRIGAEGINHIKSHRFFAKINWTSALEKKLTPPHIPQTQSPTDISNFSSEFTSMPISESVQDLHAHFHGPELFRGFSFVSQSLL